MKLIIKIFFTEVGGMSCEDIEMVSNLYQQSPNKSVINWFVELNRELVFH